jgi:adenosylhomocysteine nucleosidase
MTETKFLTVVSGKSLLFVMAAEAEYGPHLRLRFRPLMTGVGPIEAAVVLSAHLARLDAQNMLPDFVVSLGSAGARALEQTCVYQVSAVSYRDMDASVLGFEKGCTPFLNLPAVLPMPVKIDGIASASLSTGGGIVSGNGYDDIDADMVDMETFAILRACQAFDLPLIGLRGISDGKAPLTGYADWTEYLHIIDEKLAEAVDLVLAYVSRGQ